MGLQDLADRSAVAVHADELEEQGDPRAELVRAQLEGRRPRASELIKANWSEWLGSISPGESLLKWESGFVIEAAFRGLPPEWSLADLLARPALRLLRRLSFDRARGISLSTLDRASSLRELVLVSTWPLEAALLLGLESLTLDLQTDDLSPLKTVMAPSLRALHTRCTPSNEALFLRALSGSRWWASLTSWSHRVQSKEGLAALQHFGPLVDRGGRGLIALCEANVLEHLTPQLRRTLPHAKFKLMPVPERPRDPEDSHGPANVSVAPLEGRMDFRELTGWVVKSERATQNEHGTDTTRDGPGAPFERSSRFTSCGWCGSGQTLCIHETEWSSYSHFETTTYRRWEYECSDCGLFTQMRSCRTS